MRAAAPQTLRTVVEPPFKAPNPVERPLQSRATRKLVDPLAAQFQSLGQHRQHLLSQPADQFEQLEPVSDSELTATVSPLSENVEELLDSTDAFLQR